MTEWLVNLAGLALIGAIVWWFWIARPKALSAVKQATVEVLVADGVYTPANIEVSTSQPITLRFLRKDPTPCAETVIFADLDISEDLVVDTPKEIRLASLASGEYPFTCQMGMYRGKLIVRQQR